MQAHSAVIASFAIPIATGGFHKSWNYPGVNLQLLTAVSRFSYQAKNAVFGAVAVTVAPATSITSNADVCKAHGPDPIVTLVGGPTSWTSASFTARHTGFRIAQSLGNFRTLCRSWLLR
jgi:hypothetical protein